MTNTEIEGFLGQFFSPPNELAETLAISKFSDLLRDGGGSALPCRRNGSTQWYGFAFSERAAREVCQHLQAFVGPSHSTLTGPATELDGDEPIDALLLAAAKGPVVRFEALDKSPKSEFPRAMSLFASVLGARPPQEASRRRPRHRVLAELELAFAMSNAGRAEALISELAASGTLSALNLTFLEIRRRQAAGEWEQLLEHPAVNEVIKLRRPALVNGAIAEAVDATYLAPQRQAWLAGDATGVTGVVEAFRGMPLRYRAVYEAPLPTQPASLMTGRVLHDLLVFGGGKSNELMESASDADDLPWLEALRGAVQTRPATDEARLTEETDVAGLFAAGEYPRVLEACLATEPDKKNVDQAFRAAYNTNTIAAARAALRWAESAPEALAGARNDRSLREVESGLRELTTGTEGDVEGVSSWQEWFEGLLGPETRRKAHAILEHAGEWALHELTAAQAKGLAGAIRACGNESSVSSVAIAGVGRLVGALEDASVLEAGDIAQAALDLVLYGAEPNDIGDEVSVRLLGAVLAEDTSEQAVSDRLSEFAERWSEFATPNRLDWLLEVLDLGIHFGGASDAVRELLARALAAVASWPNRNDQAQLTVLRSMAEEIGEGETAGGVLPAALDAVGAPEQDPLASLTGKTVGIYTLFPGAAQRVAGALQARCEEIEVETNADHVATDALVSLAKRADVMLVAFGSAQHAATDAIVGTRGRDRVVRTQGRGSAGMLRALEDWAGADQP